MPCWQTRKLSASPAAHPPRKTGVQGVLEELHRRGITEIEDVKVREEEMAFTPPREMKLLRMAQTAG